MDAPNVAPGAVSVDVSTPTDADLRAAQQRALENTEGATPQLGDYFQSAEMRHQTGGRYDSVDPSKGQWDHDRDFQYDNTAPQPAPQFAQNVETPVLGTSAPTAGPSPVQFTEGENFQKKYGDALNQIGAERQQAAAREAAYQQQLAELNARFQLMQMQASAGGVQNVNPYGYAPQPAAPPPPPQNFFPGRAPEDVVSVAEVNALMYGQVAPALDQVRREAVTEAYNRAAADMSRRFGGWDVTPIEEARVLSQTPSLKYLPQHERDMIVQQVVKASRPAAPGTTNGGIPVPGVQPQFVPVGRANPGPVAVDPRQVMRTQTFVEQRPPATAPVNEPLTPQQFQQRVAAELDACKTAKEMEAVFAKYGLDVNKATDARFRGQA